MENASGKAAMREFLKHPLFLLLVTFALTGIIVPAIARSWQIRQKELEIKIDLISDVSESVMTFLMAIQFVHVMPKRYPDGADRLSEFQKNLDKQFSEWEVRRSVIGTKLEAYLPDKSIPEKWTNFCGVVSDFYAQEGIPKEGIQTFATGISGQLSRLLGEAVGHSWDEIKQAILKMKAEIIVEILASRRLNIRPPALLSIQVSSSG
jgi:hypothetical protein